MEVYAFYEKGFKMKSLCLLGERVLVFNVCIPSLRKAMVICSWKSVWYILVSMEKFLEVFIDMVFVICTRSIYRYFVGKWICKMSEEREM